MAKMEKFVYPYEGVCPECKSRNLKRDARKGEVVCSDCGLVIKERKLSQQGNKQSSGFYRRYP